MKVKAEGTAAVSPDARYTYKEYKSWSEGERWELIEGVAYAMSLAPTRSHQRYVVDLVGKLYAFLKGKPCELLVSPVDVFLPASRDEAEDDVDTVVQPDVIVVCDTEKLIDKGVRGGPDFVVEILSPHTAMKDLGKKKALYAKHGVREYWILNPEDKSVLAYRLEGESFGRAREYRAGEDVDSTVLSGFAWRAEVLSV
jgi:Uma2 family endonuclease